MAVGGINFTSRVINRDLDSKRAFIKSKFDRSKIPLTYHLYLDRDYLMGAPVRDVFGNDLGAYQVFDDATAMDGRKKPYRSPK